METLDTLPLIPETTETPQRVDLPPGSLEAADTDGWNRLIVPIEPGISVMFKGRNDLPDLSSDSLPPVTEVSLRPLYADEDTALAGGASNEAQYAYAASRNSSPRLISTDGGVEKLMEHTMEEVSGRDIVLVVDETPEGFSVLFKALCEISSPSKLSETAQSLAQTSLEPGAASPERNELLDSLATDLTVALMSEDLTPHEALGLVFQSHFGDEESRAHSRSALDKLLAERLKKDDLGGRAPDEYHADLATFIEVTAEKNDFWVHRDKGVLRPGQKVLSTSAYVNYPRTTTHGCLNVAIDIGGNIYGAGNHGLDEGQGATTVVSPVSELARLNGLPLNYEAGDTFWQNPSGMVMPQDSLYVTVSGSEVPADLASNEIWLPNAITDQDMEQQLQTIAASIQSSILGDVLSKGDEELLDTLKQLIREADDGSETRVRASAILSKMQVELFQKQNNSEQTNPIIVNDELSKKIIYDAKIFEGKTYWDLDYLEKNAAVLAVNMTEDQAEQAVIIKDVIEHSLAEARIGRRADYLQVKLSNMYMEQIRGKVTPKLESMGRGLDWDTPGQKEMIKADAQVAESSGLFTGRHPDHLSSTIESSLSSAWEYNIKNAKTPQEADYGNFIRALRSTSFALAFQYVRKGLISFDQINRVSNIDNTFG
jgi:hypothetical protein